MNGTAPKGASVTSGAVSTFAALSAGNVTINTVAIPAIAGGANAVAQVDQLVAVINSMRHVTGVQATRVTTTTFKLEAGVDIVVAALGGTATLANTGLTAGTTAKTAVLLATRHVHGSSVSGSDQDIVKQGNVEINVKHARAMGLLGRQGATDIELSGSAVATRVNA